MSAAKLAFLNGSLNHKILDERIEEIADQCSSWFTPAGSNVKQRMLDHSAFARSIISELDMHQSSKALDKRIEPFELALKIIASGHGCPHAVAEDALKLASSN